MTTPIEKHWKGTEYNDAAHLDIKIERVTGSKLYARCVVVHLLTKQENMGNHNLYMDVIDQTGKRLDGSVLRGQNNNISLSARIDKPPNEFGTNFVMHTQDTIEAWVQDAAGVGPLPSDHVKGFSTRWGGDKVGGQDYGHVSYYVIWQITTGEVLPPPEPPPPPVGYDYAKGFIDGVEYARGAIQKAVDGL